MKNMIRNFLLIFLCMIISGILNGQNVGRNNSSTGIIKSNSDEEEVKETIERFLFVAGNYDLEAMDEMIVDNAMIGIVRFKEDKVVTSTLAIEEYFENAKNKKLQPYFEPVSEYTIHVDDGHLAFVRADAVLHRFGVPLSHNIDYFTLIKENGEWKFLSLSFTATPIPEEERKFDLIAFGKSYAQAWCSQRPDFVAMFYAEEGWLNVNDGTPAVGRDQITKTAESYMIAFPDIIVMMDSLVTTPEGIEFHWTFTGTNTGPGGTGKNVRVSGFELWQLEKGLIKESRGSYDAEEYVRQVKYGYGN
ncbi:MAG: ester cyclase [Ignavibacteria bacterium]|jgi:hypothetical protein